MTGSRGSSQILFNDPYSTAFDIYGNLFVVDSVNDRIQFFSRGKLLLDEKIESIDALLLYIV